MRPRSGRARTDGPSPMSAYPLDPLTPNELTLAARLCSQDGRLGADLYRDRELHIGVKLDRHEVGTNGPDRVREHDLLSVDLNALLL